MSAPRSSFLFWASVFVALASGGLLIARILGFIQVNWLTVIIAGGLGGFTAFNLIKERYRKAYIRNFSHDDWTVENADSPRGVFIRITAKEHGAGNKPQYNVEKGKLRFGYDDFVVDVDDSGNVTVRPPDNRFTPPNFGSFLIRIT